MQISKDNISDIQKYKLYQLECQISGKPSATFPAWEKQQRQREEFAESLQEARMEDFGYRKEEAPPEPKEADTEAPVKPKRGRKPKAE